jgi:hypothetical protein
LLNFSAAVFALSRARKCEKILEETKKKISDNPQDHPPRPNVVVPVTIAPAIPVLLSERRRCASKLIAVLKSRPSNILISLTLVGSQATFMRGDASIEGA